MAFSGLTVTCCFCGTAEPYRSTQLFLRGRLLWSEEPASNTPTTKSAPDATSNEGAPTFSIRSSADAWIAIGKNPNPAASPRIFVPANETTDLYTQSGDRLAWIAA